MGLLMMGHCVVMFLSLRWSYLCSRPLILEQCPAPEDRRDWPDLTQDDPFANMGPADCKRWAFLCQHNLPRTLKGYLAIPIPIRACIDNCYFRGAAYLLGSRCLWYMLADVYYKRPLKLSERGSDGRHVERITCTYIRWWECHFVLKLTRLQELGLRLGTGHAEADTHERGLLCPAQLGETDGIFD